MDSDLHGISGDVCSCGRAAPQRIRRTGTAGSSSNGWSKFSSSGLVKLSSNPSTDVNRMMILALLETTPLRSGAESGLFDRTDELDETGEIVWVEPAGAVTRTKSKSFELEPKTGDNVVDSTSVPLTGENDGRPDWDDGRPLRRGDWHCLKTVAGSTSTTGKDEWWRLFSLLNVSASFLGRRRFTAPDPPSTLIPSTDPSGVSSVPSVRHLKREKEPSHKTLQAYSKNRQGNDDRLNQTWQEGDSFGSLRACRSTSSPLMDSILAGTIPALFFPFLFEFLSPLFNKLLTLNQDKKWTRPKNKLGRLALIRNSVFLRGTCLTLETFQNDGNPKKRNGKKDKSLLFVEQTFCPGPPRQ